MNVTTPTTPAKQHKFGQQLPEGAVVNRGIKSKRKPPAYQPSFEDIDKIASWPRCQRCRKKCSPVVPVRVRGGVFVPRCYCNNCGMPLEPLTKQHIDTAQENIGLIRKALQLHRRDLFEVYQSNPSFSREMNKWAIVPLALLARRHDPKKLSPHPVHKDLDGNPVMRTVEFSTYAIAGLRNLINKAFPFIAPVGLGGESDAVFHAIASNTSVSSIDEEIDNTWHQRRLPTPPPRPKITINSHEKRDQHGNLAFASYGGTPE